MHNEVGTCAEILPNCRLFFFETIHILVRDKVPYGDNLRFALVDIARYNFCQ